MKKMMFDDRFGLTKAVLRGSKTMTRRIVPSKLIQKAYDAVWHQNQNGELADEELDALTDKMLISLAPFKTGETVALAQSYRTLLESEYLDPLTENEVLSLVEDIHPGCTNKLYVKPHLMPHRILILSIKVERLRDISEDDCMREGIIRYTGYKNHVTYTYQNDEWGYETPREAFAALIDEISGKGTWEKNPLVFTYYFSKI